MIIANLPNGDVESEVTIHPSYTYHRQDYVHCTQLTFQVAAVNEVGKGNLSDAIKAGFLGRKLKKTCHMPSSLSSVLAIFKSFIASIELCLLYTSPSPRDATLSRMPSSA